MAPAAPATLAKPGLRRCAACDPGAVVVALAEPRWSRPEQIVLVVDNAAGDAKAGQLAAAKEAAGRWIAGLNDYDQMAILSAGRTPTVSSGWTSDRAKLREALDSITAVDAAAEMPATLALAHWMTADRPGAKIVPLDSGGGTAAANPPLPRRPLWLFFAGAARPWRGGMVSLSTAVDKLTCSSGLDKW